MVTALSRAGSPRIVSGVSENLPRGMTDREADLLQFMLSDSIPDVEVLRDQARSADVARTCSCGCGTIDFGIDSRTRAVAPAKTGPIAEARAREFDEHPVELLLFLRHGRLSSLEIVWYDESQRTGLLPPRDFWSPPTRYGE